MTILSCTSGEPPPDRMEVWDAARLASLIADVGEPGLRDLLRLFMADMPLLQQQFARAVAAGDAVLARGVLAVIQDSAAALGLAALIELTRQLADDPLRPGNSDLLVQEVTRIRFVPNLKHAS